MKKDNINKIQNTSVLLAVEELFTSKRKNGVISHNTAALAWGFSNLTTRKIDITFPKSKVSNDIKKDWDDFNVYQQVIDKYIEGIETIEWEGKEIRIYSPERTIVEIIKEKGSRLNDTDIETIKTFFKYFNYDHNSLNKFSKLFNVEYEVNFARSLLNE